MSETLIPNYGLSDLSSFSTEIEADHESQTTTIYSSKRKINLEGIAAAYIDDMNSDGIEDMIVVRYKADGYTPEQGREFHMILEAYTIQGKQVKYLDGIEVGASHYKDYKNESKVEKVCELQPTECNVYVNAITDGKSKYILVDSIHSYNPFIDQNYEYHTVYELDGENLKAAYAFEQNKEATCAGYPYMGYVGDEGTLWCNEPAQDDESEEKGVCKTYEEAIVSYFASLGFNVLAPKCPYGRATDSEVNKKSIITEKSLVANIFSYEWFMVNAGETPEFEQKATDHTNVATENR